MSITDLTEKGYTIAQIPAVVPHLARLREEIYSVFSTLSEGSQGKVVKSDADVIEFHKTNQPKQYLAVKQLWCAPALFAVGGHESFTEVLKKLDFRLPIHEVQPLLRCDMPIKGQSIFKQHQDYSYNIGSANSVTIWIPLQDTNEEEGALLVAPGSHKKGIYPNQKIILSDYQFDFEPCPVRFGEALIFDQKLVHQSGRNRSNKIRFSVQLRFSDLGCEDYAERGFPVNHKVINNSYAGEV